MHTPFICTLVCEDHGNETFLFLIFFNFVIKLREEKSNDENAFVVSELLCLFYFCSMLETKYSVPVHDSHTMAFHHCRVFLSHLGLLSWDKR